MGDTILMTDSCCDLPPEMLEAAGIEVLPLSFTLNDVEHLDDFGKSMPLEDFYRTLDDGASVHTSQVSLLMYAEAYERAAREGKSVVLISLSSVLSGTYETAVLARENFLVDHPDAEIHCIDSKCASTGQGLLVLEAARRLSEGATAQGVAEWVEANKLRVNHYFTVDSFDQLVRGGRVSAGLAMAGALLSIKPVLYVDASGALVPVRKPRGRHRAIETIAELASQNIDGEERTLFVCHGNCPDDADALRASLADHGLSANAESRIGTVIGAHTGSGVLSAFFWGTPRN